ncbi:xanthine dehydrogenase [Rhizobium sp. L43]|nr:xanthine dehydrogenase [Rhizobium sp. L43]
MAPMSWAYPEWPMFGLKDDALQFALSNLTGGRKIALATIIHSDGGGPRPAGTQMAFTDRQMTGFLSGGCIEADVALHARAALLDGHPRRLIYGQGSPFRDLQLQCGASITIAVERVLPSDPVVHSLLEAIARREEVIWISDGRSRITTPCQSDPSFQLVGVEQSHLAPRQAGRIDAERYWVRYRPQTRLIVIGSDPTALAIAQLAKEAEFEVVFVRPLGPNLPPPIAPHLYRTTNPQKVFEEFRLDHRTAVIFANHDFEASREDVARALRSKAGYVGMVGARRQRPAKDRCLREFGLSEAEIAKFKSPVGLPVGRSSPFAIAISVIAEVLRVMNEH